MRCGNAKSVELMRRPEIGGQLFNELSWRCAPVGIHQALRDLDPSEPAKPLAALLGRKRSQVFELPLERSPLYRELVIVFGDFTQEIRKEAQRQHPKCADVALGQPHRFRGIRSEMLGLEVAGKHVTPAPKWACLRRTQQRIPK